jgi:HEAT repeat protein
MRHVRRGLWSTDPGVRLAAAVNARAVIDPALIDVLIDRLEDSDLQVRRAAAQALAHVSREALAAFDPAAEGKSLSDQVVKVRKAFRTVNLEQLIARPLPLALCPR